MTKTASYQIIEYQIQIYLLLPPSSCVFSFRPKAQLSVCGRPSGVHLLAFQWAVFYMPPLTCPYPSRQLPADHPWPIVPQQMLLVPHGQFPGLQHPRKLCHPVGSNHKKEDRGQRDLSLLRSNAGS